MSRCTLCFPHITKKARLPAALRMLNIQQIVDYFVPGHESIESVRDKCLTRIRHSVSPPVERWMELHVSERRYRSCRPIVFEGCHIEIVQI